MEGFEFRAHQCSRKIAAAKDGKGQTVKKMTPGSTDFRTDVED
jgi:hypothetical protein